jgi:hypothetical protein
MANTYKNQFVFHMEALNGQVKPLETIVENIKFLSFWTLIFVA